MHQALHSLLVQVVGLGRLDVVKLVLKPLIRLIQPAQSSDISPSAVARVLQLLLGVGNSRVGLGALLSSAVPKHTVALMATGSEVSSFLAIHLSVRCAAMELAGCLCDSSHSVEMESTALIGVCTPDTSLCACDCYLFVWVRAVISSQIKVECISVRVCRRAACEYAVCLVGVQYML